MKGTPLNFKKSHLALTILTTIALAGCGSDSSAPGTDNGNNSGSASNSGSETVSKLSGSVADGYLVGAKVCLDLNLNKACDDGEPSAITGEKGAYSFNVDKGTEASAPIVVEVTPDTVDEDTNLPVGKGYVLSAPPGKHEFISPLTTMVMNKLELNPTLTVQEAEGSVKSSLGLTVDAQQAEEISLFDNYVHEKGDEQASQEAKREFERLHSIAKVVARTMGNYMDGIKQQTAANGQSLDEAELKALVTVVVESVLSQIGQITNFVDQNQIDTDGDGKGDGAISDDALAVVENPNQTPSENVTGDLGLADLNVDKDDLVKIADELDMAKNATKATLEKIMKSEGMYWARLDNTYHADTSTREYLLGFERIKYSDAENIQFDRLHVNNNTGELVAADKSNDYRYMLLTSEGFKTVSESSEKVEFDSNGDGYMIRDGQKVQQVKAVEVDVAGKLIVNHVDEAAQIISPDARFDDGATAYQMTFKRLESTLEIPVWECPNGEDTAKYGDNCNWVYSSSVNGPMTYVGNTLTQSQIYIDEEHSITLRTGGFLSVFRKDASGMSSTEVDRWGGKWQRTKLHGHDVVVVYPPKGLVDIDGAKGIFFILENGFVRRGYIYQAGAIETDSEWGFDKDAVDDIINAIDARKIYVVEETDNGNEGGDTSDGDSTGGDKDEGDSTVEPPYEPDWNYLGDNANFFYLAGKYFAELPDGSKGIYEYKDIGTYHEIVLHPSGQTTVKEGWWRVSPERELSLINSKGEETIQGVVSTDPELNNKKFLEKGEDKVYYTTTEYQSQDTYMGTIWSGTEGACDFEFVFDTYTTGNYVVLDSSRPDCQEKGASFKWKVNADMLLELTMEGETIKLGRIYKRPDAENPENDYIQKMFGLSYENGAPNLFFTDMTWRRRG